jgi:hypothetical protein
MDNNDALERLNALVDDFTDLISLIYIDYYASERTSSYFEVLRNLQSQLVLMVNQFSSYGNIPYEHDIDIKADSPDKS